MLCHLYMVKTRCLCMFSSFLTSSLEQICLLMCTARMCRGRRQAARVPT